LPFLNKRENQTGKMWWMMRNMQSLRKWREIFIPSLSILELAVSNPQAACKRLLACGNYLETHSEYVMRTGKVGKR
jgi:hypothetical protein